MASITDWTIPGADGEAIVGNCHRPEGESRGVILIAHGFKGYKDYGMFPRLARASADAGLIAHRFNFSHSGMTNRIETFERPDLFEQDSWNKQVFDYRRVIEAVAGGELDGAGSPYVMFGHSRGGVTALLTAGRFADDGEFLQPNGVITAAAPSGCNFLAPEEQDELLATGFVDSPSSRTGQCLRIGRVFLQEQLNDPDGHDVLAVASHIRCASLIIHGSDDPTVEVSSAGRICNAMGERANEKIIKGADHVFNATNPMPDDAEAGPQLRELLDSMTQFALRVCESV